MLLNIKDQRIALSRTSRAVLLLFKGPVLREEMNLFGVSFTSWRTGLASIPLSLWRQPCLDRAKEVPKKSSMLQVEDDAIVPLFLAINRSMQRDASVRWIERWSPLLVGCRRWGRISTIGFISEI